MSVTNLLHLYSLRLPSEDLDGRAWYPLAHAQMRTRAAQYARDVRTVAAVTAALSPQCEWTRNLLAADAVLADRAPGYGPLPVNVRKARVLAESDSWDLTRVFTFAPKVSSFAVNLAGNYVDAVTLDTHAGQAYALDPRLAVRFTPKSYARVADAYRAAAETAKLEPAHFQAVIWLVWRRLYPWTIKNHLKRSKG